MIILPLWRSDATSTYGNFNLKKTLRVKTNLIKLNHSIPARWIRYWLISQACFWSYQKLSILIKNDCYSTVVSQLDIRNYVWYSRINVSTLMFTEKHPWPPVELKLKCFGMHYAEYFSLRHRHREWIAPTCRVSFSFQKRFLSRKAINSITKRDVL